MELTLDLDQDFIADVEDVLHMADVADGDAFDVLLQALAKGALEGLELFVDQDVEDDALEVGFKAPFGEVDQETKMAGGQTHDRQ
ncbi:hypothetical protein [Pseudomonas sp. EA_35y_Pfl2_R5]|uniref:hypothetical protein n=1 Tax=Pseudomonas sp. EA_35y_Pfl2_R5 TaxID=3088690 RepID=UPI0030D9A901